MNYYNQSQMPKFNPQQFQQMVTQMPNNMLQQLVVQAQMSGIKQSDIQNGLNYIYSLQNKTPNGF